MTEMVDQKELDELEEGLDNFLDTFLKSFGIKLDASDRSDLLINVHAVADGAEEEAEDIDFEAAYVEALADMNIAKLNAQDAETLSKRVKMEAGRSLRRVVVGLIQAKDLIDTGEFISDIESAAIIIEDQ